MSTDRSRRRIVSAEDALYDAVIAQMVSDTPCSEERAVALLTTYVDSRELIELWAGEEPAPDPELEVEVEAEAEEPVEGVVEETLQSLSEEYGSLPPYTDALEASCKVGYGTVERLADDLETTVVGTVDRLNALESHDIVEFGDESVGDDPDRTYYRVTDLGHATLDVLGYDPEG